MGAKPHADRHGKVRYYLRRRGRPDVPLRATPGSAAFLAEYQAALAIDPQKPAPPPGSFDALCAAWVESPGFRQLRASTQRNYARILGRLRASYGDQPIALLEPRHVRAIVVKHQATPAAANHILRMFRLLGRYAFETGMLPADPTAGVRRLKEAKQGFPTWMEEDIAAFEARWPSGTKPRLAFALFLYTGQRRSDVVRMGRQHLRDGLLHVRQAKTGKEVWIPLHSALRAELEQVPADQVTFLLTEGGRSFSPNGLYNNMVEWARLAGVPKGRSPHGLRKAAAVRLAEAGASSQEIMAITGHTTLAEVERYTRDVAQKRLAESAMARLERGPGKG